jgi:hypothetical protein
MRLLYRAHLPSQHDKSLACRLRDIWYGHKGYGSDRAWAGSSRFKAAYARACGGQAGRDVVSRKLRIAKAPAAKVNSAAPIKAKR